MKKIIILLICSLFVLTGCSSTKQEEIKENPIVTMEFESYGNITIELYPNEAYNTVANFVNLIEDGFYDDNAITRVQKGFVIQAGGLSDPGYTIKGEFTSNGVANNIKHEEGVISMARSQDNDSASGQFFIMLDTATSLDGQYAAFGKVIDGMDIIHEIEDDDLSFADEYYYFLEEDSYIKIKSATVDTKGYTYKVEKIK